MILNVIKVLLVFWIVSSVLRWWNRPARDERRDTRRPPAQKPARDPNAPADPGLAGNIVDAEFEELDRTP